MIGNLEDLRRQLTSCEADLAAAPRWKSGSPWHTDRVNERDWLRRTIARMEAEAKYLARK